MKKLFVSISLLMISAISFAKPVVLEKTGETVSVYTLYGGASIGVATGLDVNLVVDGMNLKATTEQGVWFSKITLPSSLVDKFIKKAEIKRWVAGGKIYQCVADNLPLIIMNSNDFSSSTAIHFSCKEK